MRGPWQIPLHPPLSCFGVVVPSHRRSLRNPDLRNPRRQGLQGDRLVGRREHRTNHYLPPRSLPTSVTRAYPDCVSEKSGVTGVPENHTRSPPPTLVTEWRSPRATKCT